MSRLIHQIDSNDRESEDYRESAGELAKQLAYMTAIKGECSTDLPEVIRDNGLEYAWQSGIEEANDVILFQEFIRRATCGEPLFIRNGDDIESTVDWRIGHLTVTRTHRDDIEFALVQAERNNTYRWRSFMEDMHGQYSGTNVYNDEHGDNYPKGCYILDADHPNMGRVVLGGAEIRGEVIRQLRVYLAEIAEFQKRTKEQLLEIAARAKAIYDTCSASGPRFAPRSGICYRCGGDWPQHVADPNWLTDLTGCPCCGVSWCE